MPGDHAVEVDRLHVVRGGRNALDGIALVVRRGSGVTGLLGRAGAGSRRCCARSSAFSRSRAATCPCSARRPARTAAPAGRVHDPETSVYGDLTVTENLRFFAGLGRRGHRRPRCDRAVDLGVDADAVVAPQRRPALPGLARRGTAGRPELLVLDEPTVGLDPVLRRDLWETFDELADAGADAARLQPRDGRGGALRRAAADARRRDPRRTTPRRVARAGAGNVESAFLALVEEREA